MSGGGHPRGGNDELFFQSPSSPAPPVHPLRINKRSDSPGEGDNPFHPAQRRPTGAGPASPGLPYPDRSAAERIALAQQQQQPQYGHEQPPRRDSNGLPYPERSSTPQSATSSQPSRHVSVVLSDAYPTPPPFKQRQGRPQRVPRQNTGRQSPPPQPPLKDEPPSPEPNLNPFPQFHQQYWPPPTRMTSTSTTAARRGSPPPPETPATATTEHPPVQFGSGAAGATGIASQRRGSQPHSRTATPQSYGRPEPVPKPQSRTTTPQGYIRPDPFPPLQPPQGQQQTPVETPPRPWTPTEAPGSYPHGPPTVWQGTGGQEQGGPSNGNRSESSGAPQERSHSANTAAQQALETEFQRMQTSSPPPSYASLSHGGPGPATTAQGYPNEKHTVVVGAAAPNNHTTHPAFHNDPPQAQQQQQQQLQQQEQQQQQQRQQQQQQEQHQLQQQQQQQQQQLQQQQQQQQLQQQQLLQKQQQEQQQEEQRRLAQAQAQTAQQPQLQQHHLQQQHHPQDTTPTQHQQQFTQQEQFNTPPPGVGPSVPPPLPEGWMAHLDQNSGSYYYIHIPTSRTQWEPPVVEPTQATSPPLTSTPYSNIPSLGSPGFAPPMTYPDPMSTYSDPGMGGMAGMPPPLMHSNTFPMHPPPQLPHAGIALFNVAPVNGEYFGPSLRYTNMDIERGIWLGSIMIITASPQPPTIHLHRSIDLSPNPRQLKANPIFTHRTWTFYRYDIDIQMGDMGEKWTYAITSHLGITRYEFLVAGRAERNWRFIAHSCNGFSLSVKQEERQRLGGVGFMWKDVMQKHLDTGGFHAQIGGGDQLYADRLWREIPLLKEWLDIKGKENRKNAPWSATHEEEVQHAYFHYYSSHFDQPHLKEAWAQIPHLLQIDDHDIFDGFGSYPEYMQFSHMFKNIGRIAVHWYLLFQHHTTLDILHLAPDERDLFTITGTGWHFVKYLGPGIAVVGIDTRSERNPQQVMAGPTYQGIFPKIATLPPTVQHCIIMLAVPIIYPRMDTAEHVVQTVATSKKAITGTYNLLGKVVGSAAGVVGAKEVVGSGFQGVKKAFGKSGLMSSVVSIFGEVDLLDDLRDHWTHESKDLERTYLIRTLQGIARQRSLRMTFLSGDVHCCGAGLVHDPTKPSDHKTMFQIISSAIVNVPPPNMVIKMLHNNKQLFIPQNGMRSTGAPSDTKEDMIEIFQTDVNGQFRELKRLMGRRNYVIFCSYDPQNPHGLPTTPTSASAAGQLSMAVDFIVQGESAYAQTVKYGPVVIPRVEPGY